MPLLYNAALAGASPALALLLARRLARGKSREGWGERWGRVESLPAPPGPRIWVHAASVGEVMAASPILQRVRGQLPAHDIVFSAITPGGHETARSSGLASHVFYAPFDVPWAVRRTIRAVRPSLFVVLETEIWPNLLHHLRASGCPAVLVNGRISDRSLTAYRRFRWIFRWALENLDAILVQSVRDRERFVSIGAAPERVRVLGSSKFDQSGERLEAREVAALREELRLPPGAPVLVVGSTRVAEEEEQVIRAYATARRTVPNLALIHAPRHVERAEEVVQRLRSAGFQPVRRTQLAAAGGPVEQVVLDTYGELARAYALADAVFIGNSLQAPGGGQNLLQALAQGRAVLYGPHMANFRDMAAQAEAAGVGFCVADADALAARIVGLLGDEALRGRLAERAVALIAENRGASQRYADEIVRIASQRVPEARP